MAHAFQIRIMLTTVLLLCLVLYHASNEWIFPSINNSKDIFSLSKIIQIALIIALFFVFVYNKLIIKVLLRKFYISGNYKGGSKQYEIPWKDEFSSKAKILKEQDEFFTITQNLFETKISGKSLRKNTDELNSTWTGKLFRQDNNVFYFALEVTTDRGVWGILKLTIEQGEANGFYFSGEPQSEHMWSFSAQKV